MITFIIIIIILLILILFIFNKNNSNNNNSNNNNSNNNNSNKNNSNNNNKVNNKVNNNNNIYRGFIDQDSADNCVGKHSTDHKPCDDNYECKQGDPSCFCIFKCVDDKKNEFSPLFADCSKGLQLLEERQQLCPDDMKQLPY